MSRWATTDAAIPLLRPVTDADLPVLYEHQRDPEAVAMAAFPPRDRDAFMTHWAGLLDDDTVTARTILDDDRVAGTIVAFDHEGRREIGYWLGRAHWGRGLATRALSAFLAIERTRPLFAGVATHNAGSIRVLEKCGFVREDDETDLAGTRGILYSLGSAGRDDADVRRRSP